MRAGAVEHMLTQRNASLPQLVAALVIDVFWLLRFCFFVVFCFLQSARQGNDAAVAAFYLLSEITHFSSITSFNNVEFLTYRSVLHLLD